MNIETQGRPSTPSLFADALAQMTTLFETEIRLLRTEITEKISSAVLAIAVLVAAAVLLLVGLLMGLFGVVYVGVALGIPTWGAFFIVGAFFIIVGGFAAIFALNGLTSENLLPTRSMNQLGKDATIVREQVK